jgi:predicted MFS family arabinose efflux permease
VTAICGIGFYFLHSTLQTLATQMAPAARGSAVSIFASALFLGSACGVAIGGAMIERVGYAPVFIVCGAGLALLGFAFSRALGRAR